MKLRVLDCEAMNLKRVEVYKNLHNGKFSVRHKGKVVGHVDLIKIQDATFAVQPAGRDRVRREKKKNVHAFVRGTYIRSDTWDVKKPRPFPVEYDVQICYDAYQFDSFVSLPNLLGVAAAKEVMICPEGIFANEVTWM